MKILFLDALGNGKLVESNNVPRIGDSIGLYDYAPLPKVKNVVWYPEKHFSEAKDNNVDIIIMVG